MSRVCDAYSFIKDEFESDESICPECGEHYFDCECDSDYSDLEEIDDDSYAYESDDSLPPIDYEEDEDDEDNKYIKEYTYSKLDEDEE